MYVLFFERAVQAVWVFKSAFVYSSCIWLFWCFLALFYVWCGFFTHENLATLL